MHTPNSPVPREPLFLRGLRSLLLVVLAPVVTGLLSLALLAALNLNVGDEAARDRVFYLTVACAAVAPLLLLWIAHRRRLRSWGWPVGGWLLVAPVLAYLATDDPTVRRPITAEEIAPSFPGAETSYTLLHRYARDKIDVKDYEEFKWADAPKEAAALPVFVEKNRPLIAERFAKLNERGLVVWYRDLNAFERIGDLGRGSMSDPIPAFSVHNALARTLRLEACALALEGRHAEAVELLVNLLGVGRKLQVNARTLVRFMTGMHVVREGMRGLEFVLARTTLDAAARARVLAALGTPLGEAGVRRMVFIDFATWNLGELTDYAFGIYGWPRAVNAVMASTTPFMLNRNRTLNLIGDYAFSAAELAAQRRPVAAAESVFHGYDITFKNVWGSVLIASYRPELQTPVTRYWEVEDQLATFREKLRH
jgi:hypothetical protein